MLAQLVDYARKHDLVAEPGFAPKTVRWALVFGPAGKFLEALDLASESTKTGRTFPKCPELSQPEMKRGGAGCRHFLVDSADVVTLLSDDPEDPKLLAKHAYFVRLLRDASTVMPALGPLAVALEDEVTLGQIGKQLKAKKAKPTDKTTFAILGQTPQYPVESDAWHDWWRSFRQSLATKPTSGLAICLASGELVEPAPTHPKIYGLSDVGGLSMGDALASFKQEAFCSYGLSQSANAPVSEEIANQYRAALNYLLKEQSRRLVKAKVTYWYKKTPRREDDPMAWFDVPEAEGELSALRKARDLLAAIEEGKYPDLADNHYYALTLSGAAGRVMVRDWMEGPFPELVANAEAWFKDLSIVRRDGTGDAPLPKFAAVLGAMVRDLDDLPAPLEASMWRVAVRKEAIPRGALAAALARMKVDIIQDEPARHARVGLLKAFHVRQGDTAMEPYLNPNHPEAAYHCGRLMALLAALQYRALGDVGAGVVQRYYAAASSTPALVLGRLVRTAQFHLNKLEAPAARSFERRLAEVWGRLRDEIPATLDLTKQSLFALGYYQQIAFDRHRPQAAPEASTTAADETASETQEASNV